MDRKFLFGAVETAKTAARRAGQTLLAMRAQISIQEKGLFDLVTEADKAAQQVIEETVLGAYLDHQFLGEETPEEKRDGIVSGDAPLWVVDPLDGTTNYVHGYPAYAVSIGLMHQGVPVLGVVYDPNRDEMFAGAVGQGATLNGEAIRCTMIDALAEALVAVGFPPDLRGQEKIIQDWQHFGYQTQGLRRSGSAALNLAYIAAGRLDGFFAYGQCPWDVAGGVVIVQEAGGHVSQHDGSPYDVMDGQAIVASNGAVHHEIVRGLNRVNVSTNRDHLKE